VVTLSQVPGARDKAERAERAVFAHLNMTPAEAAQRSTVLVSEQRWRTLRLRLAPALGGDPRVWPALMG